MYFKIPYDFTVHFYGLFLRSEFVLHFSCRIKIVILTTLPGDSLSPFSNHDQKLKKIKYCIKIKIFKTKGAEKLESEKYKDQPKHFAKTSKSSPNFPAFSSLIPVF